MTVENNQTRIPSLFLQILLTVILISLSSCRRTPDGLPPPPTSPQADVPTATNLPLPDLTVQDISLDQLNENICDISRSSFQILIKIINQGEIYAGPFMVQVNESQEQFPEGLGAGESRTVSFFAEELINIHVDSSYMVTESNKTNNRLSQKIVFPTFPPRCTPAPTPIVAFAEPTSRLEGHTSKVLELSFSPEGNLIASGSVDNTMRLWRVNEANLLRTMRGHPFPILTTKFSPDGSFLVTGSTDGLMRIWRVSNGMLENTLEAHSGWLIDLDISPDGKYIATCGHDFTVRIWKFIDGKLLQTIDEGMTAITKVRFSPDGSSLAWVESDGTLRVRSINGSWIHILRETTQAATSLAYSPDGNLIVTGHADGTIRIWSESDGILLQTIEGHTDTVSSLSVSPDGKWLVSGSWDNILLLWRFENEEVQTVPALILIGHSGPVNSVAFSPKGDIVAGGSDDSTIQIWTVPGE
ncbi:CARDB domain-containing protein [Chloroflexota bacterium]